MSTEPVNEAAFFSTIRSWRLVRSESRVFGGVLGGLGSRIGMAAAPTRVLFALAAIITGGLAVLAYAAAWALMPDHEGHIIAQDFGRGRPNVGALIAIGVLTVIGFISLGNVGIGTGWMRGGFDGPNIDGMFGTGLLGTDLRHAVVLVFAIAIPLLIIGGIVAVIVWAIRSASGNRPDASGYARLPDGTVPDAPAQADAAAGAEGEFAPVAVAAAATTDPGAGFAKTPVAHPAPPLYYSTPAPMPTPRKPRVPGPGKVGYLLALALIPISIAITVYLSSTDQLAVYPVIVAGVIFTAGLGLILVINALRGRKAGFLGFVSVVALIPTVLVIGGATEIRQHYATGDWPTGWNLRVGNDDTASQGAEPAPIPFDNPFDPSAVFFDYDTVAIDGTCNETDPGYYADYTGTVSLSEVTADQTITVSSQATQLVVPAGTSIHVVPHASHTMDTAIDVNWLDRDVTCNLNYSSSTGVQLTNTDAPVLTVVLDDVTSMGSMSLWIEEN